MIEHLDALLERAKNAARYIAETDLGYVVYQVDPYRQNWMGTYASLDDAVSLVAAEMKKGRMGWYTSPSFSLQRNFITGDHAIDHLFRHYQTYESIDNAWLKGGKIVAQAAPAKYTTKEDHNEF